MGLCFSKKEDSPPDESKAEKKSSPRRLVEDTAEKKRCETPVKMTAEAVADGAAGRVPVVPSVEKVFTPAAVFGSSSCTQKDVDAILIHCGRLSRCSSANSSAEAGAGRRKYSGSKRSYDFDGERKGDEEEGGWAEKSASRPSPRRRTPSRERSGSRERGGRRISRSPGRRPEVPGSTGTCSEGLKQPVKMVVVPPRDKGRGVSPVASSKRGGETASVRTSSPGSLSTANTRMSDENAAGHPQLQFLSQSSSRTPMKEIDENTTRANQNASKDNKVEKIKDGDEGMRNLSQTQSQISSSENCVQISKSLQRNGAAAESKGNAAGESKGHSEEESSHLKSILGTKPSGDFDQIPRVKQETFPSSSCSIASCVSKACDLDSASSENKNHVAARCNHDDDDDIFDELPKKALLQFVEPEIAVDDNLLQRNLHKYVTVRKLRADLESEESAGSNSLASGPWAYPSGWEPHWADSNEGRRSLKPNGGEVADQEAKPSSLSHQSQQPVPEVIREPETRGRRPRGDSSVPSNNGGQSATSREKRREPHRRAQLSRAESSANGGGRDRKASRSSGNPLPTAAAS